MRNDIREKLKNVLKKEIEDESQVVYILSRIRKIIEIDKSKKEYSKLNFYCKWALHAELDRLNDIEKLLLDFKESPFGEHNFLSFGPFDEEFKRFLDRNRLTTTIYESDENVINFKNFLADIYSDTPLTLKAIKKVFTFRPSTKDKNSFGMSYVIRDMQTNQK